MSTAERGHARGPEPRRAHLSVLYAHLLAAWLGAGHASVRCKELHEKNLHSIRDAVKDDDSFIEFLRALAEDRAEEVEMEKLNPSSPYGSGADGWENGTIEAFLEAASAWGEASKNGLELYEKPKNPWRRCADIIHMGKIYE